MAKASSTVASVTQQSRQRVPQSRTEYRERLKATWVQTVREHSWQLDTVARYRWGSDESRWWLCTWRAQARQANGDITITVTIQHDNQS